MIDPLLESFDVTVEHGAGAAPAHLVPDAMNIEPFCGTLLAAANLVAHLWIEYFSAAAGERTEARLFQNGERFGNGKLEDPLREMPDLDGGECLDDDLRIESAEAAKQFEIPILVQSRMQATDHVYFGDPGRERFLDCGNNILDRTLERVRVPFLRRECAKLAGKDADVRVIDVAIEDVGGDVAVFAFPDCARHDAEGVEIVRAIQPQGVRFGKALLGRDLFGNGSKITGNER